MPDRSLYPKKRGRTVGPSDVIAAKFRKKTGNTQSPLNTPPPFGIQRQRVPMANSNLPTVKNNNKKSWSERQMMRAMLFKNMTKKGAPTRKKRLG